MEEERVGACVLFSASEEYVDDGEDCTLVSFKVGNNPHD